MGVFKKTLCFSLLPLILLLAACGNKELIEEEGSRFKTVANQAAEWLSAQIPSCDVITTEAKGEEIILLTGMKNPGTNIYAVLKTFVVTQDNDSFSIIATHDGEASISNGFTAYGFCTEEHTVIFGDTMDSVYDYLNDRRVDVTFKKAYVYLEDGSSVEFSLESNAPYLVVLDGKLNVTDMEFWSAEFVAKYSLFYSEDLIRSLSGWGNDPDTAQDDTHGHEAANTPTSPDEPSGNDGGSIQDETQQYIGEGFQLQIPASGWIHSMHEMAGSVVYTWESANGTSSSLEIDFFQSDANVVLEDYRLQGYTISGNTAKRTDTNDSASTVFFHEVTSGGCWRVILNDSGGCPEESNELSAMANSFELC